MIPLDLEDTVVLRRTLVELEARIPILERPITPIAQLDEAATLLDTIRKLNEVINGFNATITILNGTNTSNLD